MNPSSCPLAGAAPSRDAADAQVVQDMVRWLERAVIGLNLCPFAKGVHSKGQIHYVVCRAVGPAEILQELKSELLALAALPTDERDTTLVMLPESLADFLDFNDFLDESDALLETLDLVGVLQIASFHPRFQFAGTAEDDVSNCTNRAPWPTLHLLREESIERAVEAFPEAETIFERNVALLETLGTDGWAALDVGASVLPPCDPQGASFTADARA
ncbi:MAG: DUF1415 domain-containing protein [Giesbergeria sp.]